jgi:hypothetical protein
LNDLEIEFVLHDNDGNDQFVSSQTAIGDIDHSQNSLIVRPVQTHVVTESVTRTTTSTTRVSIVTFETTGQSAPSTFSVDSVPPGPQGSLVDDPEPTDPSEMRLRFKIEQRGEDVRLVFPKTATIANARVRIAEKLAIDPGTVALLYAGKALQDKFLIDRLRIGEQGITVYIKDDTEVVLQSVRGWRRS